MIIAFHYQDSGCFLVSIFFSIHVVKSKKKNLFSPFDCLSYIHLQVTVCASEKRKKRYFNVSLIFCFYSSMISNCRPRSAIIKLIFKLLKDAGCQDKQQHYNNIIIINLKKFKKKSLKTVFLIESTPSISFYF